MPYESIQPIEKLGEGYQGVVYKGNFEGDTVAVKYVKNEKMIKAIRGLLHLRHRNLIQFLLVFTHTVISVDSLKLLSKEAQQMHLFLLLLYLSIQKVDKVAEDFLLITLVAGMS